MDIVSENIDFIKVSLQTRQVLQPSNDIVKAILEFYKEETGNDLGCCSDCILEAFQWCLDNYGN